MNELGPRLAVTLGCVYFLIFAAVASIDGQMTTSDNGKRATFARESSTRLSAKGNSGEIRAAQTKVNLWQKTKSEDDWLKLTDAIHFAAAKSETKSSVTIGSSAGSGAVVKYQTLGQRKRNETPTTAKTPTESHELMYIGVYYIWSMRDGKATSDVDAQYEIAKPSETVVLVEVNKKN